EVTTIRRSEPSRRSMQVVRVVRWPKEGSEYPVGVVLTPYDLPESGLESIRDVDLYVVSRKPNPGDGPSGPAGFESAPVSDQLAHLRKARGQREKQYLSNRDVVCSTDGLVK